jgi:hypothetical protein
MTLCQFQPYGRQCPNPATVTVTLTGCNLPPDEVPTCDQHVDDWRDEVAATAVPIQPGPTTADHVASQLG